MPIIALSIIYSSLFSFNIVNDKSRRRDFRLNSCVTFPKTGLITPTNVVLNGFAF